MASKPAPGVRAGAQGNRVSNMTVSQATSNKTGGSIGQGTAVGSGSRPTPSKVKIMSSNPVSSQMIRPTNKIGGTGYKG
jgi:hypothetical protein